MRCVSLIAFGFANLLAELDPVVLFYEVLSSSDDACAGICDSLIKVVVFCFMFVLFNF